MIRLAALWLMLLLLPVRVAAQDGGIHRCVGADGGPLFTDQPCAALQATPVTAAREPPSQASPTAPAPASAATPPVLCASSVAELRQSVLDAFASRNPNRLAGLMLWGGYGHEAVVADIRAMNALMQRTLLDVGEDAGASAAPDHAQHDEPPVDAAAMPAHAVAMPPAAPRIVVRTAADDGSGVARETHFSVVRRSGCLWLRNSG